MFSIRYFVKLTLLVVLFSLGVAASAKDPALEPVPGWSPVRAGLPAAATWPVLRQQGAPLHLLLITGSEYGIPAYQRIARRLGATLDMRYLLDGFDHFHINDKWIEPSGTPTADEAFNKSWELALESIALKAGKPQADVLFLEQLGKRIDEPVFQTAIKAFVEAGGIVVMCGNFYPKEENLLSAIWPAIPTKQNNWMQGGSKVEDAALLAGVPTNMLSAHNWIPIFEVAPDAISIASGLAGSAAARKVGKGTLLFVPTGPYSRRWDSFSTLNNEYDQDDIWLRYWDTLLYQLVRGANALPVFAHIAPITGLAVPGQPFTITATVTNRAQKMSVLLALHVTSPRGTVLHSEERTVTLAAGEAANAEFVIPVAASWPAGRYPVYLTVADSAKRLQLHQALEYLNVPGQLSLKLDVAQKGYRLGETAELTIHASSPVPWQGKMTFGVYDFRGRLYQTAVKDVTLDENDQEIPFTFKLTDPGVTVDTYYVQVAALQNALEWGRTSAKVYKYEPWSMRNEYQWSTWAGIGASNASLIPRAMTLMAHAGMNALGFPLGRSGIDYTAERWGWRYYNEGVGMNTFSPVIEYENMEEMEAAGLKQAAGKFNSPEMISAAFIIGSVGEEAGFKNGWGTRYYWDEPVAPEKANKAFQWYLRTRYPNIATLNEAWGTKYDDFTGAKLTKEFSGTNPTLDTDGWATPLNLAPEAGVDRVTRAPYIDTADFYNWYYDRIIEVAQKILRDKINPRTLTMSSAPTIGSGNYEIRQSGPTGWDGYQTAMISEGEEPGFGMTWGHFDWNVKTESIFWDYLMKRSGHNNYWLDLPLMVNRDMSHTRATFAMRKWVDNFAGRERIILDSRQAKTQVGILGGNGAQLTRAAIEMTKSLQVAVTQAGFGYETADWANLNRYKIIFLVARRALAEKEAIALNDFVRAGGTLLFTPQFSVETEHGVMEKESPGWGLSEIWQFSVTEHAKVLPKGYQSKYLPFTLDTFQPELQGMRMVGESLYRETVEAPGWKTQASYEDGVPALMDRTYGAGRLVFLNAMYNSHRYIQFVSPTDENRLGFYKLIEALCAQSGARRDFKLEGPLNQILHLATKQFSDESGDIQYLIVNSYGEVPYTAGTLAWQGEQRVAYDVLASEPGTLSPQFGKEIPLQLRPGAGKLLALVRTPVGKVQLATGQKEIAAGEPITVTVNIVAADGKAVPGKFPFTLTIAGPAAENLPGLTRSFSAANGEKYTINTAMNDPAGKWTISIRDGITGLSDTAQITVRANAITAQAPAYQSQGWASETWEPERITEEDFLQRLRDLTALYQRDYSQIGWMSKQLLGYYYDEYPGTRHTLLRPLNEADWTAYVTALQRTITAGETIILTGEDVNIDPGSGLATWPHGDGKQMTALASVLKNAKGWEVSADGAILRATLGTGKLLLCRESIDAAGNRSEDAQRWQASFLARLAEPAGWQKLAAAPAEAALRDWWTGQKPLGKASTMITFADGTRKAKLTLDPAKALSGVLVFVLPVGVTTPAALPVSLAWEGDAEIQYDLGCDNKIDLAVNAVNKVELTEAAKEYLQKWTAERDGNNRVLIPLRLMANVKVEVTLSIEDK